MAENGTGAEPQSPTRRWLLRQVLAAATVAATLPARLAEALELGADPLAQLRLAMVNVHTAERLSIDFGSGEQYRPETMDAVRGFLRDHHDGTLHDIDPKLIDTIFAISRLVGHKGPIQVLSGYRSPQTNAWLRQFNEGVAPHSFHMQGKAIDFHIPGLPLDELHKAALSVKAGGVGYYPFNQFIHVDVGPVRTWGPGGGSGGSGGGRALMATVDRLMMVPRGFTGLTPYQARRLMLHRRALLFDVRRRGR